MAQARHPLLLTAAGFPISLPTPVSRTPAKTEYAAGRRAFLPALNFPALLTTPPPSETAGCAAGGHVPPAALHFTALLAAPPCH